MWSLLIAEGRSYDLMLRAAQLALALDRQEQTHVDFEKEDVYAPWRHLLEPSEQLLLRTMGDAARTGSTGLSTLIELAGDAREGRRTADFWQQGAEALATRYLQTLVCRPATGAGARPPPDTWLLLTGEAGHTRRELVRDYQRVLAFAPYVPARELAGVVLLPPAVSAVMFSEADAPRAPGLLIVGSGDPAFDLSCVDAWQTTPDCPPCIFFDPYHTEPLLRRWGLPASVRYAGGCPAPARAALYQGSSLVVAASDAIFCDNHFVWEAVAAGAKPLAHFTSALPYPPTPWTVGTRAEALAAAEQSAPRVPVPRVLTWQEIPPLLKQAPATAAAAGTPPQEVAPAPHHVRLHASGPAYKAVQAKPKAGVTPVAMVVPGAGPWDPSLRTRLQRYNEIYVDISEGTAFFVGCITEILDRPVQSIDQFEPTLHHVLQRAVAAEIDIIHLGNDAQRLHQHQAVLTGLSQREAGDGGHRVPTLVIHAQKPVVQSGPSKRRIGVGVATDVILNGLGGDAAGRYQLRWVSRQPSDSERGRVYFYPLPDRVGFDKDEIDYAALPGLLEREEIDMLCGIDPYLSGLVAARATWARRAVPVVGMLHSIHPNSGVTDTLFQLASGASLPVDTIISPTRCGAESYQSLLDATSEWLGHFTPTPPRYAGNIEVIPYGIETAHYEGLHKPACRLGLDIPQDAVVLLSFGRFSRQEKSDLTPLLLAFQKLRARHPQTRLILAGAQHSKSYLQHLRELAHRLGVAEAVTFKVDVDASDKTLYYGAADIFVTPSDNIQETYGLTLLEAMAAGLPTVASGWNGYREIVRHGETGLLVKTYAKEMPRTSQQVLRIAEGTLGYGHRDLHESVVVEPDDLLQALETLVRDPHLRRTMGDAGRRVCRAEYEQATQSRRTGDLLMERIREAARVSWPVPGPCKPFYDPVSERFANYPQDGYVSDDSMLHTGAWGTEKTHQEAILASLDITSRQEQAVLNALLAKVAESPGISLASLGAAVCSSAYSPAQVMARAVRCAKYGLLRLTDASA